MQKNVSKKAFTLIELILVITIIAVLAAAVFIALDPARRLNSARNAQRRIEVSSILDAIKKHQVDNGGELLEDIALMPPGSYRFIGTTENDDGLCGESLTVDAVCNREKTGVGTADCVNLLDLGTNYLSTIPSDPLDDDESDTAYYVHKDANGATITVGTCDFQGEDAGGSGGDEDGGVIEMSR